MTLWKLFYKKGAKISIWGYVRKKSNITQNSENLRERNQYISCTTMSTMKSDAVLGKPLASISQKIWISRKEGRWKRGPETGSTGWRPPGEGQDEVVKEGTEGRRCLWVQRVFLERKGAQWNRIEGERARLERDRNRE